MKGLLQADLALIKAILNGTGSVGGAVGRQRIRVRLDGITVRQVVWLSAECLVLIRTGMVRGTGRDVVFA